MARMIAYRVAPITSVSTSVSCRFVCTSAFCLRCGRLARVQKRGRRFVNANLHPHQANQAAQRETNGFVVDDRHDRTSAQNRVPNFWHPSNATRRTLVLVATCSMLVGTRSRDVIYV